LSSREIFQSALNESEGVINVRKYKPEAAKTVKVELESFPDPLPTSVAGSTGSLNEEIGAALSEILAIVKETIQARTVAFCWVNRAKKRLIVSAVQTDAQDFTSEKSLPFQSDAVTQIVIAKRHNSTLKSVLVMNQRSLLTTMRPTASKHLWACQSFTTTIS